MKKRIFAISFLFLSSLAFASSVSLEAQRIEERGREQFRDTLLWKEKALEGRSGSNQYVEYFTSLSSKEKEKGEEGERKLREQGILLGTNSNLLKYPDVYLGVSMGYSRGEEQENNSSKKDQIRNYGANAEFAYLKNHYLLLGGLGYTELRHTPNFEQRFRERERHIFTEFGRFFPLSENDFLYSFAGLSFQKVEGQREIPSNDIGLVYTHFWNNKWNSKIQLQHHHEWKERREENNGRNRFDFLVALSYRYYEDLEIQLQYRGKQYHKQYKDAVSLGVSHNF